MRAKAVALTASIGIAAFPLDACTADELLEKADAAMYYSKQTGRNRVSFYIEGALVSAPRQEEILDDRAPRC
jgi:predicted signal transduction protein with EAL and GGDEF domain